MIVAPEPIRTPTSGKVPAMIATLMSDAIGNSLISAFDRGGLTDGSSRAGQRPQTSCDATAVNRYRVLTKSAPRQLLARSRRGPARIMVFKVRADTRQGQPGMDQSLRRLLLADQLGVTVVGGGLPQVMSMKLFHTRVGG